MNRRPAYLLVGLLLAGLLFRPHFLRAEEGNGDVNQRLRQLEEQVRKLSERPDNVQVQAGTSGFQMRSADGDFILKFHGLVQADSRLFLGQPAPSDTDTFLMRRVRPILDGTLYKNVDFRIAPDFGGGTSTLYDAYLDVRASHYLALRAGKFKSPVGLERLQSSADLMFVERALPSDLIPNRDVGWQLFGETEGGVVSYQGSFANGAADGASDDSDVNNGKEGALRIFVRPLSSHEESVWKELGVGLAGTYANNNTLLPTFKTPGQSTFFTYNSGVTANGKQYRLTPQASYYLGSFGFMTEYVRSAFDVRKNAESARLANQAWQMAVSFVLTGEKASYKGVTPRKNFDPSDHTWGALEVAARCHELTADPDTYSGGWASPSSSAKKAHAWAVGANWYLNRAVKFMTDYEETRFTNGAPTGDRPTERLIFTRWQISF